MFVGLQTSADSVFLFKQSSLSGYDLTEVFSKAQNRSLELESVLLKTVVRSGDIGRYWANPSALVLFPYQRENGTFRLIQRNVIKTQYSNTWEYLILNKKILENREHGKFKGSSWYQLYPKNLDLWEQPKIMMPYMVTRLSAYYDRNNYYFVNVTTGGFGLTIESDNVTYEYLTGLLNSKLIDWYFRRISTNFHGGYFGANKQFLSQIPIHLINHDNPTEVLIHNKLVTYVKCMLDLHKRNLQTPNDKQRLQREIEATDAQIDRLVYELYGLTDEEIRIVEGEG